MPVCVCLLAIVLAVAGLIDRPVAAASPIRRRTPSTTSAERCAVGGINGASLLRRRRPARLSVKLTALAPTSNAIVGLIWTQAASDGTCGGGPAAGVRAAERAGDLGRRSVSGPLLHRRSGHRQLHGAPDLHDRRFPSVTTNGWRTSCHEFVIPDSESLIAQRAHNVVVSALDAKIDDLYRAAAERFHRRAQCAREIAERRRGEARARAREADASCRGR